MLVPFDWDVYSFDNPLYGNIPFLPMNRLLRSDHRNQAPSASSAPPPVPPDKARGKNVHYPDSARGPAARSRTELRYHRLFDKNVAGVYILTREGRIIDLNDSGVRILGCASRKRARGSELREFVASDADYDRLMKPLLERGSVSHVEMRLRRRGGDECWVMTNACALPRRTSGEYVIQGTMFEITREKQAEIAARLSEERFRALVENSADAISLVDREGKVLYSSHAVSPIFGYSLSERVGKNIFELVHPEDRNDAQVLLAKLLTEPAGSTVSTVVRYRHKDLSWRWIEALATNLLAEPSVRAVAINYRDITERKLLEQQFYQAQKMEAIGRLAGGVAHDFNNLLTAILGYSDMTLEMLPADSQARRYTAEIKKAGERAALLTRQLLAFSRLQVMSPHVIDLNSVIVDMSKILRRLAGEDISVSTMTGAPLAHIRADPSQVEQVIMNLAVNARDAMPSGGKLTFKTSEALLEDRVTAEGIRVKGGRYVLLEVSDTGCGMDADVRSRVFDPFFTTKERGKGTGLGLSTVYGIVKQSSGYIWVASEPGAGTVFSIYLPLVDEDLSAQPPAAARVHRFRGAGAVLVVEDEDSVRTVLARILNGMGYEVLEAPRGEEALRLCEKRKEPIQLLITDMAMPRMKGQELSRRVAAIHPETRVLFMTGYAGNKVGAVDVLEHGAAFISKPFTPDALGQKIRDVLGGGPAE